MARKPRIEIIGGLYHIITRGNNRRRIFGSENDYLKFLAFLASQKAKRPFYLYAYCLMPNHVHLLTEMLDDPMSRVMHGLLTGYSQYHNRKYKKIGHLFQGRYKAILCQTDRYLGELVRYIHLNPVRAKIVARPEEFEYSGHRAYLGMDRSGLVDVEPVLRHFGANKKRAIEMYVQFVNTALGEKSQKEYYQASEGRMLGNEEFRDEVKHRIGDHIAKREIRTRKPDLKAILKAAENATGVGRKEICTNRKSRALVMIKEAIIVIGDENGILTRELADALRVEASAVSKRRDTARLRAKTSGEMARLLKAIRSEIR
ncbi:MAG TPA: transposase [Blastocatellia bacterium]|nr:transposase [Blastocatellia bacterium]